MTYNLKDGQDKKKRKSIGKPVQMRYPNRHLLADFSNKKVAQPTIAKPFRLPEIKPKR